MKKLHLLSLFFLLAAVSVAFTSCDSNDEPSMNEDTDHRLTEWVEPYAVMKGSPDDARSYMAANQPRYVFASDEDKSSTTAIAYKAKDNHSMGIVYGFMNGGLYTVISSEFTVNLDLVVNCLQKKYIQIEVLPEDSYGLKCLYKFTNEQKNMEIKLYENSKEVFSLSYTRK